MQKLQTKMIVSYSFIAVLIVSALSFLFNFSLDKLFEQYANKQREIQIAQIITQVNQQYLPDEKTYSISCLEVIGNAALQNGIILHVQTLNGEIDWDIRQHRAQECQLQLQHAELNMHSRYPNFRGGYTETKYELTDENGTAGYLIAGYYGPYSFDDNELLLINALNRVLISSGLFFLFVAVVLGIYMARKTSTPITNAIAIAQSIAGGENEIPTMKVSTTRETSDLLTALKEMSIALEKKDQQKKQITEDVAHELRTPLSNIQSHLEALIDGVWMPTRGRLQSCHDEVVRISGLVDQLAELSLIENESSHNDMCIFNFDQLCSIIVNDFEAAGEERCTRIECHIPPQALLYGNEDQVKQCIVNLLTNAMNYTSEGETITLSYTQQGDVVCVQVCDNGQGIPADSLPHIFERFYRVDKSRSKRTGGMGIGLSITKAIVEGHGGTICVNSKIGEGTTFFLRFPLQSPTKGP